MLGWTHAQTIAFLRTQGWVDAEFLSACETHKVDGYCLLHLTKDDLKTEFGITALGTRQRILRHIAHAFTEAESERGTEPGSLVSSLPSSRATTPFQAASSPSSSPMPYPPYPFGGHHYHPSMNHTNAAAPTNYPRPPSSASQQQHRRVGTPDHGAASSGGQSYNYNYTTPLRGGIVHQNHTHNHHNGVADSAVVTQHPHGHFPLSRAATAPVMPSKTIALQQNYEGEQPHERQHQINHGGDAEPTVDQSTSLPSSPPASPPPQPPTTPAQPYAHIVNQPQSSDLPSPQLASPTRENMTIHTPHAPPMVRHAAPSGARPSQPLYESEFNSSSNGLDSSTLEESKSVNGNTNSNNASFSASSSVASPRGSASPRPPAGLPPRAPVMMSPVVGQEPPSSPSLLDDSPAFRLRPKSATEMREAGARADAAAARGTMQALKREAAGLTNFGSQFTSVSAHKYTTGSSSSRSSSLGMGLDLPDPVFAPIVARSASERRADAASERHHAAIAVGTGLGVNGYGGVGATPRSMSPVGGSLYQQTLPAPPGRALPGVWSVPMSAAHVPHIHGPDRATLTTVASAQPFAMPTPKLPNMAAHAKSPRRLGSLAHTVTGNEEAPNTNSTSRPPPPRSSRLIAAASDWSAEAQTHLRVAHAAETEGSYASDAASSVGQDAVEEDVTPDDLWGPQSELLAWSAQLTGPMAMAGSPGAAFPRLGANGRNGARSSRTRTRARSPGPGEREKNPLTEYDNELLKLDKFPVLHPPDISLWLPIATQVSGEWGPLTQQFTHTKVQGEGEQRAESLAAAKAVDEMTEKEVRLVELKKLFLDWDHSSDVSADASGYVEVDELEHVLREVYRCDEETARGLAEASLAGTDENQDGKMEWREFYVFMYALTFNLSPVEFLHFARHIKRCVRVVATRNELARRKPILEKLFKEWAAGRGGLTSAEVRRCFEIYNSSASVQERGAQPLDVTAIASCGTTMFNSDDFSLLMTRLTSAIPAIGFDRLGHGFRQAVEACTERHTAIAAFSPDAMRYLAFPPGYEHEFSLTPIAQRRELPPLLDRRTMNVLFYGTEFDPAAAVERCARLCEARLMCCIVSSRESALQALEVLNGHAIKWGGWVYFVVSNPHTKQKEGEGGEGRCPNFDPTPFLREVAQRLQSSAPALWSRIFMYIEDDSLTWVPRALLHQSLCVPLRVVWQHLRRDGDRQPRYTRVGSAGGQQLNINTLLTL